MMNCHTTYCNIQSPLVITIPKSRYTEPKFPEPIFPKKKRKKNNKILSFLGRCTILTYKLAQV